MASLYRRSLGIITVGAVYQSTHCISLILIVGAAGRVFWTHLSKAFQDEVSNHWNEFWVFPRFCPWFKEPRKPAKDKHFTWLLLTCRSSSPAQISHQMSKLLTLSLSLSPAILQMNHRSTDKAKTWTQFCCNHNSLVHYLLPPAERNHLSTSRNINH